MPVNQNLDRSRHSSLRTFTAGLLQFFQVIMIIFAVAYALVCVGFVIEILRDGDSANWLDRDGVIHRSFDLLSILLSIMILTMLRNILLTVNKTGPFIVDNVIRLTQIVWLILASQLTRIILAAISFQGEIKSWADIGRLLDQSLSSTHLLLILLCFVLAQIFAHGVNLREENDGTI